MPKKTKVLTKTLYVYAEPANRIFAMKTAKEKKISGGYSGYVNDLITAARKRATRTQKSKAA